MEIIWFGLGAIVLGIILFFILMRFIWPSTICTIGLGVANIITLFSALANIGTESFSGYVTLSTILGFFMWFFAVGPSAFEDTRETNTYLIFGTLVDHTTGDSPTKTFFSILGGNIIVAVIKWSVVTQWSNVGVWIAIVVAFLITGYAVINLIKLIFGIFN